MSHSTPSLIRPLTPSALRQVAGAASAVSAHLSLLDKDKRKKENSHFRQFLSPWLKLETTIHLKEKKSRHQEGSRKPPSPVIKERIVSVRDRIETQLRQPEKLNALRAHHRILGRVRFANLLRAEFKKSVNQGRITASEAAEIQDFLVRKSVPQPPPSPVLPKPRKTQLAPNAEELRTEFFQAAENYHQHFGYVGKKQIGALKNLAEFILDEKPLEGWFDLAVAYGLVALDQPFVAGMRVGIVNTARERYEAIYNQLAVSVFQHPPVGQDKIKNWAGVLTNADWHRIPYGFYLAMRLHYPEQTPDFENMPAPQLPQKKRVKAEKPLPELCEEPKDVTPPATAPKATEERKRRRDKPPRSGSAKARPDKYPPKPRGNNCVPTTTPATQPPTVVIPPPAPSPKPISTDIRTEDQTRADLAQHVKQAADNLAAVLAAVNSPVLVGSVRTELLRQSQTNRRAVERALVPISDFSEAVAAVTDSNPIRNLPNPTAFIQSQQTNIAGFFLACQNLRADLFRLEALGSQDQWSIKVYDALNHADSRRDVVVELSAIQNSLAQQLQRS
jgi:hypothetical protein